MKVSVAMCTYNGERFLQEQLESIRVQTHPPAELVVCDDGSTDGTAAIIEAFRQSATFPVRWFRNTTNLGSSKNFAQAIERCTGEAIALCDQDDRWMPQKLATSVRALEADARVAGVFSNARLMDEQGVPVPGDLWSRVKFDAAAQAEFRRAGARYLVRRDTVTGATFVFRARYVAQLLPVAAEWVHDGWLALVLASLSQLQALPEPLITYRLHAAQQVGATVVPLATHLHTRRDAALQFHWKLAHRFQCMADHLAALSAQGAAVDPSAQVEVAHRVRFQQARATLLTQPRHRRFLPALANIAGYTRYEKGALSLLRDLAHEG